MSLTELFCDVDDRNPNHKLTQRMHGKLFGDRGYISQTLAEQLWQDRKLLLITKLRKNYEEPFDVDERQNPSEKACSY